MLISNINSKVTNEQEILKYQNSEKTCFHTEVQATQITPYSRVSTSQNKQTNQQTNKTNYPKNSKNNHKITQAKFLQFPNLSLVKHIQTTFPDIHKVFLLFWSSKLHPLYTQILQKKYFFFESRSSSVS